MGFDYSAAEARVSSELGALTERLWSGLGGNIEKSVIVPPNARSRTTALVQHQQDIPKPEMLMLLMLSDLSRGSYWHADDNWKDIRKTLSPDDERFYAEFMIEQARRGPERGRLGYCWIVESHDNGNLSKFITQELLAEAVNQGFWEFANLFLANPPESGLVPAWDYYLGVMKHRELIDLTRVSEFRANPLRGGARHGALWPDRMYVEIFQRNRGKLDLDSASFLARPIIEVILRRCLSCEEPLPDPEKLLSETLKNYMEYLKTPLVQNLFKEAVADSVNTLRYELFPSISNLRILRNYVAISEAGFRDLVSSSMRQDSRLAEELVAAGFPTGWLDSGKRRRIRDTLEKSYASLEGGFTRETPNRLTLLQRAVRGGIFILIWQEEERFWPHTSETMFQGREDRPPVVWNTFLKILIRALSGLDYTVRFSRGEWLIWSCAKSQKQQ